MIAGYNLHDGGSFVGRPHSMSDTDLGTYFATRFGPNVVSDLDTTYPTLDIALPPGCSMAFMRASSCETDWSYACETHMVADALTKPQDRRSASQSPTLGGFSDDGVYIYEFSQVSASSGLCLHGADVPYVFGTVSSSTSVDALKVSAEVQTLWATFAKTGIPSSDWPRWSAAKPQLLNITAPDSYVTGPAGTCPKFLERKWDYYKVCLPDNPDLCPM